jgi:nucleoside-diphosphate-sugar epimerase
MSVAVTGASGFLGSAIVRALASSGRRVVAMVREGSPRDHIDGDTSRYVVGDHSDPSLWPELLEGADAVVHNSADWDAMRSGDLQRHLKSNLDSSLGLLHEAHKRGVKKFCFISSVATLVDISPKWRGVIDEDHPLRPGTLYGAYKASVEAHLWAAHQTWGMHCVALRPCAVYGVEPTVLDRTWGSKPIRALMQHGRVDAKDFPGGGKFVHRDDVALAVVRSLDRDEAAGKAFNLVDTYAKHTRFAEHAAEALGLPPDRVTPDTGPGAKNRFDTALTREVLGVDLNRGDTGLRTFAHEFVRAAQAAQHAPTP